MVERVNGKVTANVLDKVRFNNINEIKASIFNYFYSYNYHIKHSGIGRITPVEALKRIYDDEGETNLKYGLDIFHAKNRGVLDKYRVVFSK